MKNIALFIIYILAIFGVYISSRDDIIVNFSKVAYNTTHLGISWGVVIVLMVYCGWSFLTSATLAKRFLWNRTWTLLLLLFLNVIVVPLSMLLVVLQNNRYAMEAFDTEEVLSIFALLILYSVMNFLLYLGVKFLAGRAEKSGNNKV